MNYFDDKIKTKCFGCGACAQKCPKSCINMVADNEGFYYPNINFDKCINCNLCRKVCPFNYTDKLFSNEHSQKAFAAIHKNYEIIMKSASGGAFSAIAKGFDKNSYIVGACYDNNLKVQHEVLTYKQINKTRKSKYIQSDINTVFAKIEHLLQHNYKILFTGTPCQVAGLKTFLGKDYNNLYLVDLICHGVPSYKAFSKYIEGLKRKYKDDIKSVEFRHKQIKNHRWNSKLIKIDFVSGKSKIFDYNTSSYLRAYDCGLMFRPSCETCPFAKSKRISDLTIGDAWGINKYIPELDVHKGVSLIIVNNEKGNRLLKILQQSMNVYEYKYENAINYNARLRNPDKGHKHRKEFFSQIDNLPFDENVNRFIPPIPNIKRILSQAKNSILRKIK